MPAPSAWVYHARVIDYGPPALARDSLRSRDEWYCRCFSALSEDAISACARNGSIATPVICLHGRRY